MTTALPVPEMGLLQHLMFYKAQTGASLNLFKTENFDVMFLNTGDSVLIRCNFWKISFETDAMILQNTTYQLQKECK